MDKAFPGAPYNGRMLTETVRGQGKWTNFQDEVNINKHVPRAKNHTTTIGGPRTPRSTESLRFFEQGVEISSEVIFKKIVHAKPLSVDSTFPAKGGCFRRLSWRALWGHATVVVLTWTCAIFSGLLAIGAR